MKTPTNSAQTPYTKGFVTSSDGTRIGYRQLGSGPGVVLLHGGVNASQHLMRLGTALAETFTVYIPDRRGRGLSGPIGGHYSLRVEDQDLAAVVKQTGARNVFGVADGALFALHGALSLPNIEKVAAYEPLLFIDQPGLDKFVDFMRQFDEELAHGRLGDAIVTTIKGSGTPKSWAWIPRGLLAPFLSFGMRVEAKRVKGDDVPLQDLLPTIHDEIELVKRTKGTLNDYRAVTADVLLLYGSKTDSMFKTTATALQGVLPYSMCIELPDLDHRSAQNYGKPERIAPVLQVFFHPALIRPSHASP
jgi:pimeloyl-ACP methyl ester carboxylesterase